MTALPPSVHDAVTSFVGTVGSVRPVGGGDSAQAARVDGRDATVFVKWAAGEAGGGFGFEAEGLAALALAAGSDLVVPAPLAWADAERSTPQGRGGRPGWLVLPWVETVRPDAVAWRRFGAALADLHRARAPGPEVADPASRGATPYGWAHDSRIGSKPQQNGWHASWPVFFGERRLLAQAETVRRRGAWRKEWDAPLDRLVRRLSDVLPEHPAPSLLHGDLWAGNAVPGRDGRFALIDPAVYVGDREADLAMTELFGGFAAPFTTGYREAWPLAPGYEERRAIYNLFHRINHLTHGPGYAAGVEAVLRRFA